MTIYIGTQGWSYKDWLGTFYPPGTRAADYLASYAEVFDAVELDTTFYGIPAASKVDAWRDSTPEGFQFTAKLPRSITHDRHLVDAGEELTDFLGAMRRLGPKLGAVLIQLPPDFSLEERPALQRFLDLLPEDIRFAAEFRHRSWLEEETFDLLRERHVAWTMIDLHYMPITPRVTADFAYVRLLGDHRKIMRMNATQIDRSEDIRRWAEEIEAVAQKVERVYGFVNNHYSGHSPADVHRLRRALGMPDVERDQTRQGTLL
jgi:uncharacterized protein YecE (DUF72 family)